MKTCRKDTICYTIIQIKTQKDNTILFNLTICHKQRIFPNEKTGAILQDCTRLYQLAID